MQGEPPPPPHLGQSSFLKILIKLNKIYKWEPEPFLSEDEMPEDIPASIKSAFRDNVANGKPELVGGKSENIFGGTKTFTLEQSCMVGV